MNTGKRIIDLSLIPDGIEPRLYVSQYDVGVTLTFNWSGTLAAGGAARVMGTKPSGIGFDLACTRVGSGTSVTGFTVETTLDMTSEAGEFPAEIRITEGTQVVGSQNFTLVVERSPHPDGTIDGYEEGRTIIETVTGLVNDAEESASEAATSATAAAQSASAAAQSATSAAADAESADASAARAMATTPEGYEEFVTELLSNQNGGFLRKNLLPNKFSTQTKNGITATLNDDGSITVNGTATANTQFTITDATTVNSMDIDLASDYILSGCPAGGAGNKYYLYFNNAPNITDIGSGATFNGSTLKNGQSRTLILGVNSGQTVSNLTFYPMVRPATIEDGTYVPYAPSNSALNADLANTLPLYIEDAPYLTAVDTYNANTIKESYCLVNAARVPNMPSTGGNYWLWQFAYQVNADGTMKTGTQIATQYNSATATWYRRQCSNGTWSAWSTIG